MTKRKELEAALANAEAALAEAAINAAKVGANRAEANANLDKTRAYCYRVRAALDELDRSAATAGANEQIDIPVKQSKEVSRQRAIATPPSLQPSRHVDRGDNKRSQDESRRRKPVQRLDQSDVLKRSPLTRQAVGLLALVLAYLLYFHIDVQLQIMSLRSVFP